MDVALRAVGPAGGELADVAEDSHVRKQRER
jgi:hypothetical protein